MRTNQAADGIKAAEADETMLSFQVNGVPVRVQKRPRLSLLMALRQDVGLRGTRIGCGQGNCGACTVLLDGRAIQSCTTPVEIAEGRNVTTIEGLGRDGLLSALQKSFIDEQAAQCGYCTNGIVMTVTALLARNPSPTRYEVIEALDERHLCRCGAQVRIIRAIERVLADTREPRP